MKRASARNPSRMPARGLASSARVSTGNGSRGTAPRRGSSPGFVRGQVACVRCSYKRLSLAPHFEVCCNVLRGTAVRYASIASTDRRQSGTLCSVASATRRRQSNVRRTWRAHHRADRISSVPWFPLRCCPRFTNTAQSMSLLHGHRYLGQPFEAPAGAMRQRRSAHRSCKLCFLM